ncbi:Tripartite DNA replication factor, partial [Kappamyces sp. JEL0680]
LVIVDPDELVSSTVVADSFQCLRRSIIKDKIRFTGDTSEVMVQGNVVHALFQSALTNKNFAKEWLTQKLHDILRGYVEDLYSLGISEDAFMKKLLPNVSWIMAWKEKSYADGRHSVPSADAKVTEALAVEERIWSSKYGLKGNIDVTTKIRKANHSAIAPLELKTGRAQSISHRAQTSLYTMMLSDRHNIKADSGLLVYLGTNNTQLISPTAAEKRGLIIGRNRVAEYINSETMPPMLQNPSTCERCFSMKECLIYHKAIERGSAESSGMGSLFDETTNYLSDKHIAFLQEWEKAIKHEENKCIRNTRDLWTIE